MKKLCLSVFFGYCLMVVFLNVANAAKGDYLEYQGYFNDKHYATFRVYDNGDSFTSTYDYNLRYGGGDYRPVNEDGFNIISESPKSSYPDYQAVIDRNTRVEARYQVIVEKPVEEPCLAKCVEERAGNSELQGPVYISKKSKADKLVDAITDFAKKGNIYLDIPLTNNFNIQYKSEQGEQYTGFKFTKEF